MRACPNCGNMLGMTSYPLTKSPFFPDGHLTICGNCLDQQLLDVNGEWATMDYICEWADVPFVPEQFTKVWSSCPEHAASQYLKLFAQAEYERLHWATYQERWKKAIADGQEKLIHSAFNQEELDRLRKTWGSTYDEEELYQLEDLYTGMKNSFGISDPTREDNAKKMCKISKEIDRCIANGSAGLDKLVTAYSKRQDINNFGSISELALYLEKTGWKKKFHNDETHDIVDSTMKNIQSYNRRLYQSESTIGDQIEDTLQAKARMDAMEDKIIESEMDQYDVDAVTINDEDKEDFDPNFN